MFAPAFFLNYKNDNTILHPAHSTYNPTLSDRRKSTNSQLVVIILKTTTNMKNFATEVDALVVLQLGQPCRPTIVKTKYDISFDMNITYSLSSSNIFENQWNELKK